MPSSLGSYLFAIHWTKLLLHEYLLPLKTDHPRALQGQIQDLIREGPQIVTGLKLPFWGLSFLEFWCWGLIFGGQGGPGPQGPPWIRPCCTCSMVHWIKLLVHQYLLPLKIDHPEAVLVPWSIRTNC